jgi:hypothetical protein
MLVGYANQSEWAWEKEPIDTRCGSISINATNPKKYGRSVET